MNCLQQKLPVALCAQHSWNQAPALIVLMQG